VREAEHRTRVIVVPEKNSGVVDEGGDDMSGIQSEDFLDISPRSNSSLSRETPMDFMKEGGFDTNRYEDHRKLAKNREGGRGVGLINYRNESGSFFFPHKSLHPEKPDTPQTIPTTFLEPVVVDRHDV
jgi:hypothetical protein